jgi:hypothetical protein
MKARRLIDHAILEPAQLAVVRTAFDQAWEAIKSRYSTDEDVTEVRLHLASSALALAAHHPEDADVLSRAILERMRVLDPIISAGRSGAPI